MTMSAAVDLRSEPVDAVPSAATLLTAGSQDGATLEGSAHGRNLFGSPLTEKAAALVKAGLPWPDQPERENETRALVKSQNVMWNEDVVRLRLSDLLTSCLSSSILGDVVLLACRTCAPACARGKGEPPFS